MDLELFDQLDRLEAAIDTVVEGITSYRPEVPAAEALVLADQDLSRGLAHLEEHQRVYSEVQTLRATAETLDSKIKSALAVLVETRHELLSATPVSSARVGAVPVAYEEVMGYARRIAKFTVPPSTSKRFPSAHEHNNSSKMVKDEGSPQAQPLQDASNGVAVPSPFQRPSSQDGRAVVGLNDEQKAWLENTTDPSNPPFVPWPSDDTVRFGALARIQGAREKGLDPATQDLPGLQKARQNSQDRLAKSEAEIDQALAGNAERNEQPGALSGSARRESRSTAQRPQALEGFDLYDPDAED